MLVFFTQDLVEFYKQHSLKEGFSSLDTTLRVPYRELPNGNMPWAITRTDSGESASQTSRFPETSCLTGADLDPVIVTSHWEDLFWPI